MTPASMDRREFLKRSLGAAAAATAAAAIPVSAAVLYDPKGLPTAVLGRTEVAVPRLGVGLGSRFCAIQDEAAAQDILQAALDRGFYYWDTASSYRNGPIVSEERIGRVLDGRRREVFLATKCEARTYDAVLREFEESLRRLRTSYIDVYQVHLLQSLLDVEAIGRTGGAIQALHKLKDEKAVRFIGFTGHLSAEAMAEAARRYDFDTMLIALNHYAERRGDMEKDAVAAAADKGLGISVIKVVRPRETTAGFSAAELIRYALSLPRVHSAMIGTDSLDVVRENAALLRAFRPMDAPERAALTARLGPFFAGRHLPWMDPGYRDA
jgi:aryl-alcohol dehydrogenase-like predicted oxidoreductase